MWIEMRKNKVKKIIKAGKSAVGTFLLSRSIANLEILAMAGFDFVVIDTEHFMKNPETIEHLIITAEATGIVPFVRIQENVNLIERALSAGARGIVVPMCNTMEVAQAAVDNGKYAPAGKRGVCNTRAVTYGATGFEDMVSFFRTENDNIMIIAQIETLFHALLGRAELSQEPLGQGPWRGTDVRLRIHGNDGDLGRALTGDNLLESLKAFVEAEESEALGHLIGSACRT